MKRYVLYIFHIAPKILEFVKHFQLWFLRSLVSTQYSANENWIFQVHILSIHVCVLSHNLLNLKSVFSHLARNPFICDCNLQWLAEYLHNHPIETSGARCESPNRMKRKKIGIIDNDKFKCKGMHFKAQVWDAEAGFKKDLKSRNLS